MPKVYGVIYSHIGSIIINKKKYFKKSSETINLKANNSDERYTGLLSLLFMNDLIMGRFKLVDQLPHSLKVLKKRCAKMVNL